MNSLPKYIKDALRKKDKLVREQNKIENIIEDFFNKEGISTSYFTATAGTFEESTEALTYIDYGEGDIEDNIDEIERVYLIYKNKMKV